MAFGSVQGQSFEVDNSKIQLDASQIVSGVLPLIRGGTGQTTIQGLKNALGITDGGGVKKIFDGNLKTDRTFDVGSYKVVFGACKDVSVYDTVDYGSVYSVQVSFDSRKAWDFSRTEYVYHYLYRPLEKTATNGFFICINGVGQCCSFSIDEQRFSNKIAIRMTPDVEPLDVIQVVQESSGSSISLFGI